MNGPTEGHLVYFVAAGEWVKVGYSNDVYHRMSQLATGNPEPLRLVHTIGYQTKTDALRHELSWRKRLEAVSHKTRNEWVLIKWDLFVKQFPDIRESLLSIEEIMQCPTPTNADILHEALVEHRMRYLSREAAQP